MKQIYSEYVNEATLNYYKLLLLWLESLKKVTIMPIELPLYHGNLPIIPVDFPLFNDYFPNLDVNLVNIRL